ncbi:NADH dehydrogenase [ubiquinone] 1 alpha subcomplex subunit 8 [Ischnura elegans]|uniref:NADH dehydrogenase [ubiquinone] 1 alpha subcomplex subunit 8 n=1 Tax=Ischnura elegans TaxID=197161 RepID=UPI001ED89246|nr:NADH dehydrogenase [ubiquinone] 1 alpha subcomplex subunit 8 [Ischnura elegans]
MVITTDVTLPTEEELTVTEINVGAPSLRAASFHFGKYCEDKNNEFILCRDELKDPRKCIQEGKAVTCCALEFFRKVKSACYNEFTQYATCIDKSSCKQEFSKCRKTQEVFDKCMLDKLNIKRPDYGYFCRPKVHDTDRPKPASEPAAVYPDATPELPEDYPKPGAKYGSRMHVFY